MKKEEIFDLAILSKLEIKEDEVDDILSDMENIIKFAQKINFADVSDDEFEEVNKLKNVYREDEVLESFPQDEILKNAKTVEDGFFCLKNKNRDGKETF